MVLSVVISRYIYSKIYTGVAWYLPAGVRRQERVPPRPHNVTGPDMIDSDLNLPDAHGSARDRP